MIVNCNNKNSPSNIMASPGLKVADKKKKDKRIRVKEEERRFKADGKIVLPFPLTLHNLLDDAAAKGEEDIVSFFPDGKAFAIHKPHEFTYDIMPRYFKTTRIESFHRQLLLYGFKRCVKHGKPIKGTYYHDLFIRGEKEISLSMSRKPQRVHRGRVRPPTPPGDDDGASEQQQQQQQQQQQTPKELADNIMVAPPSSALQMSALESPLAPWNPVKRGTNDSSLLLSSQHHGHLPHQQTAANVVRSSSSSSFVGNSSSSALLPSTVMKQQQCSNIFVPHEVSHSYNSNNANNAPHSMMHHQHPISAPPDGSAQLYDASSLLRNNHAHLSTMLGGLSRSISPLSQSLLARRNLRSRQEAAAAAVQYHQPSNTMGSWSQQHNTNPIGNPQQQQLTNDMELRRALLEQKKNRIAIATLRCKMEEVEMLADDIRRRQGGCTPAATASSRGIVDEKQQYGGMY